MPPTNFSHVVYRTHRFDEMLHWYQTVFDARIQFQDPVLAFLTYDDEHHRFAFANLDVLEPDGDVREQRAAVGVDHVAYTFASLHGLLENYAALKEEGITPYWCVHHGITVSMYYADPDENQMEFQVESYPSADDATAFMHGAGFGSNPIGVEYDPEELLVQLRAGTPESGFLVRHLHEPVSPVRGYLDS